MRALLAVVAVLVVAGLLVAEGTMQPSSQDRAVLYGIFAAMAAATAAAGWALPKLAKRFRSVRTSVQMVALASVVVAGGAVGVAAVSMFLSAHDLRLVLVALGLGVGLGLSLAITVARPLAADLQTLAGTASRVGGGDLGARTGIQRPDEVGVVATAMDQMAARLEAVEDERGRTEAARRALLAAVGHDLRTPLTSLQAAVEALQDGLAPDPERYLRSMSRDLEMLRGLVEDVFLLARIEAGLELEPVPVDVAELADGVVETVQPVAGKRGVEVRLEAGGPVVVHGDPRSLSRVIRNLLDNAVRHAPEGSGVVVEVSGGAEATVRVSDQGEGFPAEFAALAFDSFTRADRARSRAGGGAGLGLAIARGLVEAHGGRVWIEHGDGGRVAFAVPLAD